MDIRYDESRLNQFVELSGYPIDSTDVQYVAVKILNDVD
jgi:hypothetical protein